MSEHTPGPWISVRADLSAEVNILAPLKVEGDPGMVTFHVAAVNDIGLKDQKEANGLLIAAAPDMLEALKRASMHMNLDDRGIAASHVVKAAIAKAEGEA